jgi:hypothetical protein
MSQSDTRTFSVTEHPTVVVRNEYGSVAVRRGNEPYVVVKAILHGHWEGIENPVTYHQDNNTITITAHWQWQHAIFGNARQIDIEVTAPQESDLRLYTGYGSIYIDGIYGQTDASTGYGSIAVDGLTGQVDLKTGSGDISMRRSNLSGFCTCKTGLGSVSFEGVLSPDGDYQLKTGCGSLNMNLPASLPVLLDARTGWGSVRNEFGRSNFVGSPVAHVSLTTGMGDINLQKIAS